jgi:hypothetical protein
MAKEVPTHKLLVVARFSASPTYVIVGRAEPAVPVAEVQSAAFTHPNEPSPNL